MTGIRNKGAVLQPRDRRLLKELGHMRLIDREQAKVVAGFGSTTRANTRLLKLTAGGLLNRFFVGTLAGGRKAIYSLSPKGALLVDAEYRGIHRKFNQTLIGDLFLEHQMRINLVLLAVKYRGIPQPGISFRSWRSFHRPPAETMSLVPDGYFEIEGPFGIRCSFVEVDLGSETQKVWKDKIRGYLQFAISGEFQRTFRQAQFRVLVIADSKRRMENIRAAVVRSTDKMFWFSTFESINRDGFWAPVWLRPSGNQMHSLL